MEIGLLSYGQMAGSPRSSNPPSGCYHNNGDLYYNAASNSKGKCGQNRNLCVCAEPKPSIYGILSSSEQHSILKSLIDTMDNLETSDQGSTDWMRTILQNTSLLSVTLFAPTDTAFNNSLPFLEILRNNPEEIQSFLMHHLKPEAYTTQALKTKDRVMMLDGHDVTVQVIGNNMMIQKDTKIIHGDILASTGVVHIIDKLLVPAQSRKQ